MLIYMYINIYIEMKVITDGTEQLINLLANDTPLQLPTFRHEVLLHRVTKMAKLQLGPIKVMKVVQQHNNTNSR